MEANFVLLKLAGATLSTFAIAVLGEGLRTVSTPLLSYLLGKRAYQAFGKSPLDVALYLVERECSMSEFDGVLSMIVELLHCQYGKVPSLDLHQSIATLAFKLPCGSKRDRFFSAVALSFGLIRSDDPVLVTINLPSSPTVSTEKASSYDVPSLLQSRAVTSQNNSGTVRPWWDGIAERPEPSPSPSTIRPKLGSRVVKQYCSYCKILTHHPESRCWIKNPDLKAEFVATRYARRQLQRERKAQAAQRAENRAKRGISLHTSSGTAAPQRELMHPATQKLNDL